MPPSIRIETLASGAKAKLGLIFSTKDRTHFSLRALEALMREDDLDLFWMDGSRTPEGVALPQERASALPRLREIHYGVIGGPDAAIIYGLTHLLGQGYDYICLLENDILLPGDWFGHTMGLFDAGERDGLKVGAVSARCLANRRLLQRHGYAVSSNLGAGMIIMRADAVRAVLSRYRTVTGPEIQAAFMAATGINPLATPPEATEPWRAAADWNFDIAMLMEGYVSLAHSPSLARHLDTAFADNPMMQIQTAVDAAEVDEAAFTRYRAHMARMVPGPAGGSLGTLPLFDRQTQCWTAFPHEIVCADPSFIKGRWELKWSQCLGPFAWIAQEAGCEITLPVFAEKCSIICGFGPECGAVDIAMLMEGYVSLAHSPSLARHLDTAFADNPMMQIQTAVDAAEVDEAAFTRYRAHMARMAPGAAGGSLGALPLFDRQTQCWTAFPHEIACADPSFIKGRWELKWSQCLGPFAWIAQEAGCEITLPVFAEKCSIICGFGPECGAVDIAMGDRYGHLDCRAADATLTMVGLEAMTTPGATLRLTVRRPGFAFYGLMASRIQAWQRGRYDFDYRTIAPLIPTP